MPDFIVPLTIRYALVSLATIIALIAGATLLVAFQVIDGASSNLGLVALLPGAYYAGSYFTKQTGQIPQWRQALKISVVLMGVQAVISLLLLLFYGFVVDPGLFAIFTDSFTVLIMIFSILFFGMLNWLATAAFMRWFSKQTLAAKKA